MCAVLLHLMPAIFAQQGGLKRPLICGKYLVPVGDGSSLLAGATFEYDSEDTVHRCPNSPHPRAARAASSPLCGLWSSAQPVRN